jgi:anti-sigma factor RsiW
MEHHGCRGYLRQVRRMPHERSQPFDETLLSGYLDGELTQAEEQRVRIQLEDDPDARRLLEEMRAMRSATMTTRFTVPEDIQWDERPRSRLSGFLRGSGWLFVGVWILAVAGYASWRFLTSGVTLEQLIPAAGLFGLTLVFLSILLDRLRDLKTDRYRRVRR